MRTIKTFITLITVLSFMIITDINQAEMSGDVSKARIVYGTSNIYSREDMNTAISIIKEQFIKWDGCELHSIRYTDDDYCNTEDNIKWMNELAESRGCEPTFTQCIAFFSDFHSPTDAKNKTAFNVDSEYTNWTWYLARTDNGEWHLMSFGY